MSTKHERKIAMDSRIKWTTAYMCCCSCVSFFFQVSYLSDLTIFVLVDNSVRDGLYHEFKKHGDVSRIYVNGQGSGRYAIIHFRRYI